MIELSPRWHDPSEVKVRQAAVAAHLERVWMGLRNGARTLTHKEAAALAGEWYRELTAEHGGEPGAAGDWDLLSELLNEDGDGIELAPFLSLGEERSCPALEATRLDKSLRAMPSYESK